MFNDEPQIDSAIGLLRIWMPTRVAEVNAETVAYAPYPDLAIVAPLPEDIFFGGSPTDAIVRYPAIEVATPDWLLADLDIGLVSGDARPSVVVRFFYEHVNFEALYRASLRFKSALLRVLVAPNSFGAGYTVRELRGSYRVNPETGEKQQFRAGTIVVFFLEGRETRP